MRSKRDNYTCSTSCPFSATESVTAALGSDGAVKRANCVDETFINLEVTTLVGMMNSVGHMRGSCGRTYCLLFESDVGCLELLHSLFL